MSESVAAIVDHWFPLIADRLKHPLDRETMAAYVGSFTRAKVTTRGLEAACAQQFDGAKWWPAPDVVISAARHAEAGFRADEHRAQTPATSHDGDVNERLEKAKAFAASWVNDHTDEYRLIVERVNAEVMRRCRVSRPSELTDGQRIMRDTMIVQQCAQEAYREQVAALPAPGRPMRSNVDWEKKRASNRQKFQTMMAQGSGQAATGSAVSGGSQTGGGVP